jgi:hypothetical protein
MTRLNSNHTLLLTRGALLAALLACGDDADVATTGSSGNLNPESTSPGGELFAFVSQVTTQDATTTFLALTDALPMDALNLSDAMELPGFGDVFRFENELYVANGETFEIERHRLEGNALVREATLSLQGRGIDFLGDLYFVDAEHAYTVNGAQYSVIEFNPTTMTITGEHDLGALRREGWGSEYRGAFLRGSDGKIFLYWAYTNDRTEFINDFVLGVFDTASRSLTVLEQPDCPATAGFGGFFDEQGDLYLIADSFGGFTFFGSSAPKGACVLRIRAGSDTIDPDYRFFPTQALGNGLAPWGLYYAGNGLAYTTAVDPAQLPEYDSVFEFIFAPVHEGWTLDIRNQTAARIAAMPPDAVGFESVTLDEQLLIPRSTAAADIYDVNDIQTTVYGLRGSDGVASRLFTMPGYLGNAVRLR